jgi:hypothetical protein
MSTLDQLISLDWLQLSVSGEYKEHKDYDYKLLNYTTQAFKKLVDIFINEIKIGCLCSEPNKDFLEPDTKIIKFDNRLLYFDNLFWFIDKFLEDHNLTVKWITRLDLAIDCNTFKNNLHPENLIHKFLMNEYRRNNKGKYKIIGEQGHKQTFEYIRFGSGCSDVSVYLYNKSKEMEQVKFKPYINNKWKEQGLNTSQQVWRLEFSLKTHKMFVTDTSCGETCLVDYDFIKHSKNLEILFSTLLQKYFSFKIDNGIKTKQKMPSLVLFDNLIHDMNLSFVSEHQDSNRMDKIFLRMIEKMNCEIREKREEVSEILEQEIKNYANKKNLSKFYFTKIHEQYVNKRDHEKEN